MIRKVELVEGEIYHIFSRGVDKRKLFSDHRDYERMMNLLYICKTHKSFRFLDLDIKNIYTEKDEKFEPEVEIISWCLMPNHFHLILKQKKAKGITNFMHKVLTSYSMYFNKKNNRTGILFSSRFQSRYVHDDLYFQKLKEYVDLNPVELFEKDWKLDLEEDFEIIKDKISNAKKEYLSKYKYSSFYDKNVGDRLEKFILG